MASRVDPATGYSVTLAGCYAVAAGLYIVVSGHLAARFAADLEELHDIELYKGLAFVTITGLALFALAHVLFRRVLRSAAEVAVAREAILRADRQVLPGLLAASIAHDFKNALLVARTSAELLEEAPAPEEHAAIVADLRAALDHATELATDLSKAGSSSASGAVSEVDVAELIEGALELVRHHPLARARTVRCEHVAELRAKVFPTLVQQSVTNLVLNALDAVHDGGRVEVTLRTAGDGLEVEVHDDGPGVSDADREHIFDPFFTTKAHGTGLGLVSVRTCAQLHEGEVTIGRSSRLGGAVFRVTLRAPRPRGPTPGSASR